MDTPVLSSKLTWQYPAIPMVIHFNGISDKTIILVEIYNQQFQGTIILMVFDLQGMEYHQFFKIGDTSSNGFGSKRAGPSPS